MKINLIKLKNRYEEVCNEYIEVFSKKQEIDFSFWVADIVGEIACFGDYFFNLSDIVLDINSEQPKHFALEWQDYTIVRGEGNYIGYHSYIRGYRYDENNKILNT